MRRVIAASVLAFGLAACGHAGQGSSAHGRPVVPLLRRGDLAVNAYTLGYATCGLAGTQRLAGQLGAGSSDSGTLAGDYARRDFSGKGRPAAERGCLDALEGRASTPPRTPAAAGS